MSRQSCFVNILCVFSLLLAHSVAWAFVPSFPAEPGNDTIYPGSGRARIRAGSGDDTVIFYNVCEFDANKLLNGGAGDDTLILPVPLASLNGVTAVGFEHIVVDDSQQHLAECP